MVCAVLLSKINGNLADVFGHGRLHHNRDVERVFVEVEATSLEAVELDGWRARLRQLRVNEVGEQWQRIEQDQDVSRDRDKGAAVGFQLVRAFVAHCDWLPKDVFVFQVFQEVSRHFNFFIYSPNDNYQSNTNS